MKFGYARVSTHEQILDLQIDALKAAGCERIYQEKASGSKAERPELMRMLDQLRTGDTVIIWKLDRLGRSLAHLIKLVSDLEDQGVGLLSLNDPIDTTTPQGRLVFRIFASLAEFERDVIRERTMAGVASARRRGRLLGRPKGLTKNAEQKARLAESLYKDENFSVEQIARELRISKTTLYKYLRHRGVSIGLPPN
ncbi:DNA invertase Pin-like site-specific DNA recombinase [Spirosoma oryzae]|uniref:DNA invertase Pin-like site-specific DNA recombinase n=1 Tax=Spirosoma oryzae TaxID=1469603 RepID=A0A2T0SNW9_9BACT|nr:recombinase family protein [Spirosoma oryzae]PRY35076.1 DNA invertase Pin-like site-specific DNA recombinase [Spirosoma oryzae]